MAGLFIYFAAIQKPFVKNCIVVSTDGVNLAFIGSPTVIYVPMAIGQVCRGGVISELSLTTR